MRSTLPPIALAVATVAVVGCTWRDAEPAVRVIPDPAGQRATSLLDAADTAMAHGKPEIARAALASAYGQPTPSPDVAYRVARLADRLDDVGTAARAYRRYLALAPASPAADTVRTRLLTLVSGPMRARIVDAVAMEQLVATGEVEPATDSAAARPSPPPARHRPPAKSRRAKHH